MNTSSSPLGLHRVIEPPGVLPQAAWRLDASPAIAPDEVRIRVDRLNLDAASYRQLREAYSADPDKIRRAVLDIITTRGKMQNPVTGSGGMLTGTVDEVGPASPLGLTPGQRRHPSLPNPDPPPDHRRPSSLGRPIRASPLRRPRHPLRAIHRGGAARGSVSGALARRPRRVRRPWPDEACGAEGGCGRRGDCGDGRGCGAGCGCCGEERIAVSGSGTPSWRQQDHRRCAGRG